jgi:hypothetical protein
VWVEREIDYTTVFREAIRKEKKPRTNMNKPLYKLPLAA